MRDTSPTLVSRRRVLTVFGTVGLAGCSFPSVGQAAGLMLIRNHRSSTTTVTVAGTDLGTNEQVIEATRTIPGEEAATVPDPTDVEDSSGGGAFIEVGTQDGLRATYQWGGGGTDVQQLRIHVHSDAITFDIGPAELPDSNDSN